MLLQASNPFLSRSTFSPENSHQVTHLLLQSLVSYCSTLHFSLISNSLPALLHHNSTSIFAIFAFFFSCSRFSVDFCRFSIRVMLRLLALHSDATLENYCFHFFFKLVLIIIHIFVFVVSFLVVIDPYSASAFNFGE